MTKINFYGSIKTEAQLSKQGHLIATTTKQASATGISNRTEGANAIILGDDSRYWVVTLRGLDVLLGLGYEVL